METDFYYLNSRYYDPQVKRFINSDAYASTGQGFNGTNMFCYCLNNPVNNADYMGNKTINIRGYGVDSSVWAKLVMEYGSVNAMNKLCSDPDKYVRNVTEEINTALKPYVLSGEKIGSVANSDLLHGNIQNKLYAGNSFYNLVNHGHLWDIKLEESWQQAIGTTFPGVDVHVSYNNMFMTPEDLGNYTYGYLGGAYGFSLPTLIIGSWYAASFPIQGEALQGEFKDWKRIIRGYCDYYLGG